MAEETNQHESKLVGLLAQFDDPDSLLAACNNAREAGYQKMDAFTPFPVHGIDPALGIKRSILPFIVLAVGLGASVLGLGLQYFANSNYLDDLSPFPGYAFKIGGKPIFSAPANIPVTFEIIVLSSAFAAFLGMWFLNRLPRFSNPLHRISRFKRATNDKFFLLIDSEDGNFDYNRTETSLNQWGAVAVEECRQDLTDTSLPGWLRIAGLLVAVLLLLPPVMIFRAKGMVNRQPRLHVVPDMDWQYKYKPQVVGPVMENGEYFFVDIRAARPPVEGSVPFYTPEENTEFFDGIQSEWSPEVTVTTTSGSVRTSTGGQEQDAEGDAPAAAAAAVEDPTKKYVNQFPEQLTIDDDFVKRGQERFNIYCSVCHGYDGNGQGLVNQRAMALALNGQASWTTAKSLHDPIVSDPKQNPVGRIYETITKGRNTMGPYGDQISPEDRWAIVAYVKALQATGYQPGDTDQDAGSDSAASGDNDSANPKP